MEIRMELRMQTFLDVSVDFYNDQRRHDFPASQIPILVTVLGIRYFNSSYQVNKLTRTISYSNMGLRTFRHGAPKSHVPGVKFLEFQVHAISTTPHRKRSRFLTFLEILCVL